MSVKQWIDVGLIYVLGVAANTALGLLPPLAIDIRGAIHGSTQDIGLVLGALYIPFLLGSALVGRLVDRVDSRILLIGGTAAMAVAGVLNLMADSLAWWIADICLMGAGLVTLVVTAQTLLATTASGKAQAGVLSLWATTPFAGITCGLLLSGGLADTSIWRSVFVIQGAVALVFAVLAALILPARRPGAAPAAAHGHGGGGGFRVWAKNFKTVRLCLGYAVVTFTTAGSAAVWPLYLSRFHETSVGGFTRLIALTAPISVLGPLVVGLLNARAVSSAKIGLALTAGIVLSTVVLYAPHIDLGLVTAALGLWALCVGAMMAFAFSLMPRLLSDQSALGSSTGLLYQLSGITAIGGAPAFFAIATLPQANLVFAGVIIACWVFMIMITPMWRLAKVALPASAQEAV